MTLTTADQRSVAGASASPFLAAAFAPRRIAVVGASGGTGKIGNVLMRNLDSFQGETIPIHPHESQILGRSAFRSVASVPGPIDLAVVAVAADHVPGVVAECAERGVPAALLVTAGLGEGDNGSQTATLIEDVNQRKRGVRLLGPNSSGLVNCHLKLNASFLPGALPAAGGISLVSQSGSTGSIALAIGSDHAIGFAKLIDCGNAVDTKPAEFLDYLGSDAQTRVIGLYLESLGAGRRFIDVARNVVQRKPVIVCKTTFGGAAQRAALSHSAALAESADAAFAGFQSAGVIVANEGTELFEFAQAFDWQPLPAGRRVGVITHSGGTGVELVGLLERYGLEVPELSSATRRRIEVLLPPYAACRNPIDTTPVWTRWGEVFRSAMRALAGSSDIDALVLILQHRPASSPQMLADIRDAALSLARDGHNKPILVCWSSGRDAAGNMRILEEARIPCYERLGSVARALAAMASYREFVDASAGRFVPSPVTRRPDETCIAKARTRSSGTNWLDEYQAKRVLAKHAIRVAEEALCESDADLTATASRIGYPVALKVVSPELPHKARVGGVALGIATPEELLQVAAKLRSRMHEAGYKLQGLLVQQMLNGPEIFVGVKRDPSFGNLLLVGLGGSYVELRPKPSCRLLPVERWQITEMLRESRIEELLAWPDVPPTSKDELIDVIASLSRFVESTPDVVELDLNPILLTRSGPTVADALIVSGPRLT